MRERECERVDSEELGGGYYVVYHYATERIMWWTMI